MSFRYRADARVTRSMSARRITPPLGLPLLLLLAALLCLGGSDGTQVVGPGALSTYGGGGSRRGPSSYIRVQDPAAGFFVGGSSDEGLNGLYARVERLPPTLTRARADRVFSLLYTHLDSGYHLALARDARAAGAASDPELAWLFIDGDGRDRLVMRENTLVPGAGVRWSRAPEPENDRGARGFGAWRWGRSKKDASASETTSASTSEAEEEAADPGSSRVQPSRSRGDDASSLAELPWQVIAVLSEDMLANLAGHKRHHDSRVSRALNCHPPPGGPGAVSEDVVPPPESVARADREGADASARAAEGAHDEAAAAFREAASAVSSEADAFDLASGVDGADRAEATRNEKNARVARWTAAVLELRAAESLRRARRLDASSELLASRLRVRFPNFADALFASALTHLDAGDPSAAKRDLVDLACADRSFPDLQRWLTTALARERRYASAAKARREAEEEARRVRLRARLVAAGATKYCDAWRQTGGCDPDGPREPESDAACVDVVSRGSSGFCECAAPREMERLIVAAEATEGARRVRGREGDHVPINTTISGRLTCAHEGGKTCDAFCRESFRAERQRVARRADDLSHRATESGESAFEEAARAARRALDAMVAWEARDDALERARRALADEEAAGTGTGAALRRAPDGGPGSGFPEADHYASLGIPADFTEAELKAGYRRASLRAHPDKVGGSSDAFARVAASYETLADDEARSAYDLGLGLARDSGSASDDETMWTEVMLEHFPEVAGFRPFGDPLENFRKHEARESARGGRRARRDEF